MSIVMILNTGEYHGDEPPTYYPFKYPPDHFQKWGFNAINIGNNILVTAHTGAGKTALALYAIAKWLQDNENMVIYTSPIKTLSNQKFKEFGEDFPNVGILTGDVKINPTGNLLIMTAEILRNSLLRKSDERVFEWNFNPDKVKCVILDEVHFINNPERGKVWEEIIVNLKPEIQLVMLSATISGAEKFAKWVTDLKNKPCHLIPTPFRPVPLHHYLYFDDDIHCIKDNTKWHNNVWTQLLPKIKKNQKTGFDLKQLFDCIQYCKNQDIIPVNIFLLNRSLAENVARKIPFVLTEDKEAAEIKKIWDKHLLKYKDIYQHTQQWDFLLTLAQKGIGVHHSGIIPILKEIVEILYELKLIKVLIATETFAMGVNMPTRAVIFTQTTKFDGNGSRSLRPEEYGQMAGRAGRRGLDSFGTVIILPEEKMLSESEAKTMITAAPQKIESRLVLDYSFILKRMVNKLEQNIDGSVVKYLADCITDTMLAKEVDIGNKGLNDRFLLQKDKIASYNDLEIFFDKFRSLKKLEEKIDKHNTTIFKLKPKEMKKLKNEIKKIELEIGNKKDRLNEWYLIEKDLSLITKELEENKLQFQFQIKTILEYLITENVVELKDDYNLTALGRIIAEVNECNPLILGHIISNGYLDNLEFHEIVAFLSIFIGDHSMEQPSLKDLEVSKEVSKEFFEMLQNVAKIVDNLMTIETKINNEIPYKFWSDWKLHLSMFRVISEWAKGELKWNQLSHLYETFEGNFCRNVLRLVNLIRNVESIALLTNNVNLINKLDGYQEKLIRDIVIIDSLYL